MHYGFFDYKYNIVWKGSDLFGPEHIVYIAVVYCAAILGAILFRRTGRRAVTAVLRAQAVVMIALEVVKIAWESYYDITTGRGFNTGGLLPLYGCSLELYTLPFAAWGRGKARACALSFLTTIGLLYGLVGVVYCNGLNYYPFWTFGAFYSLYFHSAMLLTGVFLLATGYHKPAWADALRAAVPVLILAPAAIAVNYAVGSDYMFLYSGSGLPLYEGLAAHLAAKGLRWVYTILMLLTHVPLALLVVLAAKGVGAAARKRR